MLWVILLIGALTLLYFVIYPRIYYWKLKGIDQVSPFKQMWSFLLPACRPKSFAELTLDYYNEFPNNRYVGLYQFIMPSLLIRDPELIKQLGVKDFDHFVDHRGFATDGIEPIWEKNLFALKGEKWRDMRATLSPSFTSSKMKGMFVFMSECAQDFVQYFENKNVDIYETEMKNIFTRYTNDVIASAIFGIKCNSLQDENNEFYLMGKRMTNLTGVWQNIRFVIIMAFPAIAKLFGIAMFDRKATNYFKNIVKTNVETREREGIVRQDMIHLLMEAKKGRLTHETKKDQEDAGFAVIEESDIGKEARRQKPALTIDDLTAQAFIFFFAGFDTVSVLLCFLAHELAVNPQIQRRVQEEIDSTWEQYGSLTYEAVTKMKYMDMVICEALRKWPAAVMVDRLCTVPYKLEPENDNEKPLHFSKGSTVMFPLFAVHRDPKNYPDPEKFDPERFSNENKHNINPYAFLSFGVGPRSCIGNRFALLETKALYFHLLRKFDIVVTDKTVNPVKLSKVAFNLQSEGGFWLGFKRR